MLKPSIALQERAAASGSDSFYSTHKKYLSFTLDFDSTEVRAMGKYSWKPTQSLSLRQSQSRIESRSLYHGGTGYHYHKTTLESGCKHWWGEELDDFKVDYFSRAWVGFLDGQKRTVPIGDYRVQGYDLPLDRLAGIAWVSYEPKNADGKICAQLIFSAANSSHQYEIYNCTTQCEGFIDGEDSTTSHSLLPYYTRAAIFVTVKGEQSLRRVECQLMVEPNFYGSIYLESRDDKTTIKSEGYVRIVNDGTTVRWIDLLLDEPESYISEVDQPPSALLDERVWEPGIDCTDKCSQLTATVEEDEHMKEAPAIGSAADRSQCTAQHIDPTEIDILEELGKDRLEIGELSFEELLKLP